MGASQMVLNWIDVFQADLEVIGIVPRDTYDTQWWSQKLFSVDSLWARNRFWSENLAP